MIRSPLWLSMTVTAFFVASCSEEPEPTAADNAYADYQASVRAAVANDVGESADDRRKRLREKAKSDPDGADAEAIDNMSRNEVVATAINSAGFLCARVTSLQSVGVVSCLWTAPNIEMGRVVSAIGSMQIRGT